MDEKLEVSLLIFGIKDVDPKETLKLTLEIGTENGHFSQSSTPIVAKAAQFFENKDVHNPPPIAYLRTLLPLPSNVTIRFDIKPDSFGHVITRISHSINISQFSTSSEGGFCIGRRWDNLIDPSSTPINISVLYQIICRHVGTMGCEICKRRLFRPVSLSCGHHCCRECLPQGDEVICPICNGLTNSSELLEDDYVIQAVLDSLPQPTTLCANCLTSHATLHCRICREFFCPACDKNIHVGSNGDVMAFFSKHVRSPMSFAQRTGLKTAIEDDEPNLAPPSLPFELISDKKVRERIADIEAVQRRMNNAVSSCKSSIKQKFEILRGQIADIQCNLFQRVEALNTIHLQTLSEHEKNILRYELWTKQLAQMGGEHMLCDVFGCNSVIRNSFESGVTIQDIYDRILRVHNPSFEITPIYQMPSSIILSQLRHLGEISDDQIDDFYRENQHRIFPSQASFHQIARTLTPVDLPYCFCIGLGLPSDPKSRVVAIGFTEYGVEPDLPLIDSFCFEGNAGKSRACNQLLHSWIFARPDISPASKESAESLRIFKLSEKHIVTIQEGKLWSSSHPPIKQPNECYICNVKLSFDAVVRQMPCMHIFHSSCLLQWLNLHDQCPLCQHLLPSGENSEHEWKFFHRERHSQVLPIDLSWNTSFSSNNIKRDTLQRNSDMKKSSLVGIACFFDRSKKTISLFLIRQSTTLAKTYSLESSFPINVDISSSLIPVIAFAPAKPYVKTEILDIIKDTSLTNENGNVESLDKNRQSAIQEIQRLKNEERQLSQLTSSISSSAFLHKGVEIKVGRFVLDAEEATNLCIQRSTY